MKRITSIWAFLIIVFASFSAVAEPAFIGAWAALREPADSASEISILRVFSDHKAYYSRQQFTEGSIGEEIKGVYTWEQEEDFAFKLINEVGEEIGLYCLINDKRLMTKDDMFVRIDFYVRESQMPEPTAVPLNNLETGFLLDPGQYTVGEDIPEGNYRFEYYQYPSDIFVHKDPNSALWSAYASLTDDSPIYAKLNLPEGSRLDVVGYPVIIMRAKPLNLGE